LTPLPASDLELCARLHRGDLEAFEELFVAHHGMLCEIVDAYVDSQATAEEIVQDLFYTIWRDRETLALRSSFRAYLCVAARNRALQHLRHRAVAERWAHLIRGASDAHFPGAAEGLERRESLEALRHAIAALPARARLAVVLRWPARHAPADALGWYHDFLRDPATSDVDAEGAIESVAYECLKNGAIPTGTALLEENLRAHPTSARAHFGLGRAYRAAGREADALERFREAVRLDSTLVAAKDALASARLRY
jgi:RNA polymerase sigma-70 factor (ECF subfamily)